MILTTCFYVFLIAQGGLYLKLIIIFYESSWKLLLQMADFVTMCCHLEREPPIADDASVYCSISWLVGLQV
jgi:hypothetical protein